MLFSSRRSSGLLTRCVYLRRRCTEPVVPVAGGKPVSIVQNISGD
jgi:hypothetical protein